jgi:Zn-finger protein
VKWYAIISHLTCLFYPCQTNKQDLLWFCKVSSFMQIVSRNWKSQLLITCLRIKTICEAGHGGSHR